MKLSPDTLSIIKNYSSINQNLWINPGSVVSTMSDSKSTIAVAQVEDTFDQAFGIYDLAKFLGVLGLFDKPEIEFKDTHMLIGEGSNRVRYVYADKGALIVPPEKKINFKNPDIIIEVTQDNIARILRASGVLSATHISIEGVDGKVELVAHTIDANTGSPVSNCDEYRIEVGKTDLEYRMDIKTSNIKMIPGDYTVEIIGTKQICKFTSKSLQLEYFLACDTSSVFNG